MKELQLSAMRLIVGTNFKTAGMQDIVVGH